MSDINSLIEEAESTPESELKEGFGLSLEDVFPFTYVGVGMFRKKGFPEGEVAPILHGMEAIKFLFNAMQAQKKV